MFCAKLIERAQRSLAELINCEVDLIIYDYQSLVM